MFNRIEIKKNAKAAFQAQYGLSVGAYVLFLLVSAVASAVTAGLGALLIMPPLMVGFCSFAIFPDAFPRLQGLHQLLNYLPRQRVEHDTLQLTYRYARKKNVPFDLIRLVFSGRSLTPLFFRLYSKRDGAEFIETIQRKYGPPQTIGPENGPERTLYWQKEDALLIISVVKNRIGFNEYHFGIYYLNNLTALTDAEKKAREQAEREKEKTGELAF